LLERGHCLQQHALSSMPGVSLIESGSFSATSLPTLVAMVEEGLGITLLPDLARDGGVARGHDLQLTALAGATPRKIALAWRNEHEPRGAVRGDRRHADRGATRSAPPRALRRLSAKSLRAPSVQHGGQVHRPPEAEAAPFHNVRIRQGHVGKPLEQHRQQDVTHRAARHVGPLAEMRAVAEGLVEMAFTVDVEDLAVDLASEAIFSTGVDTFFMEYDTDPAGGLEPLKLLPKCRQRVMPGFITTKTTDLEDIDRLKSKFDEASKCADPDQLGIAPQCGFAYT
jgi:hypothetical protein